MDKQKPKRKKAPRLESFDYSGWYSYSVTICCYKKQPLLTGDSFVGSLLDALARACSDNDFIIPAYCFMPDHFHLLLSGDKGSILIQTIKSFKQVTSFQYHKKHQSSLWQRGYYDHILRKQEDLMKIAQYIWNNPARQGLERRRMGFPYSGPAAFMTGGPT